MKSPQEDTGQVLAVVYHLSKTTQEWEELGTGFFNFQDKLDAEGILVGHCIVVNKLLSSNVISQNHESRPFLIQSQLEADKMYMRQQGTIICWNEIQLKQQIAVTFSDKKTCDQQWKRLCSFIGKNPYEVGILPPPDAVEMPRQDNLDKLVASVAEKQQAISYYIINKTKFYLDLLQVSRELLKQQADKSHEIYLLYRLIKGIIEYNDSRIIQILFQPSSFPIILEIYNQCLSPTLNYQQMLSDRFQLVTLIPFSDEIVEKIKVSHYITFFKDVVLTSSAAAPLEAALLLSIQQINMDIFNEITSEGLMHSLYLKIQTAQLPQAINFLYEELIFAKQFNDDIKKKLIQKYYTTGIVERLATITNSREYNFEQNTKLKIIEIISKISYFNEKSFFEFLKTNHDMMQSLIHFFHTEKEQIMEAVFFLFKNFLTISIDKKGPTDLMISFFFPQQTNNVKQSHAQGLEWKRQLESMTELIIVAIQVNDLNRTSKILEIFFNPKLFQLLMITPLTKIQKLKRLKLISMIISHTSKDMLPIQQSLTESKFLRNSLLWLTGCNHKNNLIESSILSILKKISASQKLWLMEEVDRIQNQLPPNTIVHEIVCKIAEVRRQQESNAQLQRHHKILENQSQQRYLNQQSDLRVGRKNSFTESDQIEDKLKLLAQQLGKQQSFDQQVKLPIKGGIEFTFEFSQH